MIKQSVRKPLTVFVAVVVVILLGFISYTKMTPDLMPNIDMPYVLVTTAYPGASSEKVEGEVTKPLEKALATLENIKEVTSTSNENYSTVVLEFNEDVNMDSITVDILQKIDSVSGNFDDLVATPRITKINPNMMPVMVAAINADNMSNLELSKFAEDNIMPELEGIAGVASISSNGTITESINVSLSDDKIKALNRKINGDLIGDFAEKENELNQNEKKIADGKDKVKQGQSALEKAQQEFADKTASAKTELEKKDAEISGAKAAIQSQIQEFNEQILELQTQVLTLSQTKIQIDEIEEQYKSLSNSIRILNEVLENYESTKQNLEIYQNRINEINNNPELTEEEKSTALNEIYNNSEYKKLTTDLKRYEAVLNAYGIKFEDISSTISTLNSALKQIEAARSAINLALQSQGISANDISSVINELNNGIEQLSAAESAIANTLTELENGEIKISDAMQELEKQKTNAILKFSSTASTLLVTSANLDAAKAQIEAGRNSFNDAKKTALKNADLTKLITKDMVSTILTAENFSMPAGYAVDNGSEYTVKVGDEYDSIDDIKKQVLFDLGLDGINPIRISDVAEVDFADNSKDSYAKVNKNNGIVLTFQKQSTNATAEVSENISNKFKELEKEYKNIHFLTLMDQGNYIYMITDSLLESLLFGALFSVLILFIFLKDIRPTVITLCSIPLSVMFSILLMYFSGVTINMMSLAGLAISVGMLVDNSVVVIENIYRLKSKGISSIKAAVSGTKQVCGAITASTLTTICVFFPIIFVEGISRQLFTDMALTIAYSLISSLIVAVTLVPSMSAKLLANAVQKPNKTFNKFCRIYEKLLNKALRHKIIVVSTAVVLLVASCGLSILKGFIFMSETDSNQISVRLEMPKTSTFEDTKKVSNQMIDKILSVESVDKIGAIATDDRNVTGYILLKDDSKLSGKQTAEKINKLCKNLKGEVNATSSSTLSTQSSMLTGDGISIKLFGNDIDDLQKTAKEIEKIVSKVDGVKEVDNGIGEVTPTIKIVINKNKAMKKGLTVAQAYQEISNALKTEVSSTKVTLDNKTYELKVNEGLEDKKQLDYIKDYVITFNNQKNEEVKLKLTDIADINESSTLNSISRENQNRLLTLTATVKDGYNVTVVSGNCEKALKDFKTPKSMHFEFAGENETIMDSIYDLFTMLLIGILLVYLIMVAQFQSLKSPFIVMFTIPLALTGGLGALLICNKEISVVSMMGFVLLCGVIVNNGIVLVDYINKLRIEGMNKKEAIVEACLTRIRPIFMTTITTVLGLLIMALGIGSGTDIMQPIAIVCIGGLIYATILTLFIVPIIYDVMNRKDIKVIEEKELEFIDE